MPEEWLGKIVLKARTSEISYHLFSLSYLSCTMLNKPQPFLKSHLLLVTSTYKLLPLYTPKPSDSENLNNVPKITSPGVVPLDSEFRSVWLCLGGGPCKDGEGITPGTEKRVPTKEGWKSENRGPCSLRRGHSHSWPRQGRSPHHRCRCARSWAWRPPLERGYAAHTCPQSLRREKRWPLVWILTGKGSGEFWSTHDGQKTNSERLTFSSKSYSSDSGQTWYCVSWAHAAKGFGVTWMPGKSKKQV